ncbi:MAG TPA: PAS domain-containing sensor histidine kinase, partial [Longimicrobiales bacterium]
RSALAFPVRLPDRVAAVLEFFAGTVGPPDAELLETMAAIGDQVGQLLRRRAAETRLREQEERYRLITQSSADAILVIDSASIIRSANPAVHQIFGWRPEELVGRSLTVLMPLELRERHQEGIAHFLATGERRVSWSALPLPGMRRDGSVVSLEISFGTFSLEGERLFTGIMRDVSGRVEQQTRLERTAAELEATVKELESQRSAAEAAREEAVEAARWFRFLAEAGRTLATALDSNEALRLLANLAVPAVADLCIVDVLQEDGSIRRVDVAHDEALDDEHVREYQRRFPPSASARVGAPHVIRTGEPQLVPHVTEEDLRAFAQDEEQLAWLKQLRLRSLMIVPLVAGGRTLGAITLAIAGSDRSFDLNDLTTVEALAGRAALALASTVLYEQALSANRAKGNFLAIMSHELRTPLTAIMGYTDIMQAGIAGELSQRQREYLERVMASARHLLHLIDEILTFSRLEVGRERTRYQRVPLRDFTEKTANLVKPAMTQKQLRFVVETPPAEIYAETDPEKVRQVLLDVLFNAAKFTPVGRVTLRVRLENGTVAFEVEDTGIGIERENLQRIFEPFWQAEEAMTRRAGGTGMGLSVAQRLTHLLGGEIDVRSVSGRGTTVTVRIPQHAPNSGAG